MPRKVRFTLVAAVACLLSVPAVAQDQPASLRFLEPGGSTVLKLPDPSEPAASWQLDAARSFALDKITLKELGGVPGLYQMRVGAKESGFAVLAFERVTQGDPAKVVGHAAFGLKIESEKPTVLSIGRGKTLVLSLKGISGAGYAWQFNPKESVGTGYVSVRSKGWHDFAVPGIAERLTGGPALYQFAIEAKSSGRANLVFDYVRPWEDKPPRRRKVIELTISE